MAIKRNVRLWLVIALQILFLLGLAGTYYATEMFGKEIRLQTTPLDPRDLFYGDYVILNYEISFVPLSAWQGNHRPESGEKVYVVLEDKSGIYQAIGVSAAKPEISGDEVVLDAYVEYIDRERIRLRYGLERYYVPEGTGRELEAVSGNLIVRVKVSPWGQAVISGLEM